MTMLLHQSRTRQDAACLNVVSGVSFGTLGELFQGPYWESGVPQISIISLPTEKYSWCYFIREFSSGARQDAELVYRPKSHMAAKLFLEKYGKTLPQGRWEFHSELPVGKGMASSSADIVAVIRCLFNVFKIPYDERVVVDILHAIERSDTVFLEHFALYLSGQHRIVKDLGNEIGLYTCYILGEESIATEELTHQLLDYYSRNARRYMECLSDIMRAFAVRDVRGIAQCASISAELSQGVVPKAYFDDIVGNQKGFHADGIFVAHTGSLVGYLFERKPDRALMDELSAFFRGLGRQCYFAKGGWGNV